MFRRLGLATGVAVLLSGLLCVLTLSRSSIGQTARDEIESVADDIADTRQSKNQHKEAIVRPHAACDCKGRYQVVATGGLSYSIVIDTVTGRCWALFPNAGNPDLEPDYQTVEPSAQNVKSSCQTASVKCESVTPSARACGPTTRGCGERPAENLGSPGQTARCGELRAPPAAPSCWFACHRGHRNSTRCASLSKLAACSSRRIRSAEPYPRGRAAPWAEEHTCDDPAPNGGVRRASARRAAFRTVPRCGGRCLWSCADASAAHLSIGELSAASPKTTTAAGAGRTEPDQVRVLCPHQQFAGNEASLTPGTTSSASASETRGWISGLLTPQGTTATPGIGGNLGLVATVLEDVLRMRRDPDVGKQRLQIHLLRRQSDQ